MGLIIIFLSLLLLVQLAIRRSNYFKPIEIDNSPTEIDNLPNEILCHLPHVPIRLQWDGHFKEDNFFHDEKLYWRIKKEIKDNPFGAITLTDISVNRSGISPQILSEPQDVFINITGEGEPFYKEFDVIELSIKKIELDKEPQKVYQFPEIIDENMIPISVILQLIHDPIPCNNAHSMFRFLFNGNIVTFDNYKMGFGNKLLKNHRKACRDDIAKMIIRRIVDFDN
jgi:hypothetical protein